ncbi:MAG: cytochrome b/b6 domain-containing protein [Proteobacteria bacterium]|nr:cytochrome b/b6 domain-containing protein [Pseudomonadota bacterium]
MWDRLVRLTHWGVAGLVLFNSFNESGEIHRLAGYVAVALVVLRLAHGLLAGGGSTAALPLPGAGAIRAHLADLLRGRGHAGAGHNPLGQWMAYLLWTLIIALGVTGWMARLDAFWGDDWLIDLHQGLANVLLGCVAVHLAGVVVMSRLQHENLVRAMLTGRKRG